MNARKRRRREHTEAEAQAQSSSILQGPFPRLACLAAFASIVVATPMLPGEAAADFGVANPLAVGWLAVAGLCLGVVAIQKEAVLHWNVPLLLVVAFGAWMFVPTLMLWSDLHPRLAINMSFVYLGAAACVFAGVQLFRTPELRAKLIALAFALGVGLSLFGLYQYSVTIPQALNDYLESSETEKQRLLQRYNRDPTPGSADRRHFEDRLKSTEPFATFALANSLAGLLAPVCVLAFAAGVGELRGRRRPSALIVLFLVLLICGACLLLTKSRTAYLAGAVGALTFAVMTFRGQVSVGRWLIGLGGAAATVVLAVGLAVLAGGLDLKVISESLKSFQYRVEYWQATLLLIADRPIFGCGPGQFQNVYPHYKLPRTSETVADPHNFLLEACATAGLPALLLLIAIIALIVVQRRRSVQADGTNTEQPRNSPFANGGEPIVDEQQVSGQAIALNFGAGCGVLVALAAGAMTDHIPDAIAFLMLLLGFAVTAPLAWSTWTLPRGAVGAAAIAWAVHHLAAGGFGFPGVAIVLWILTALLLTGLPTRVWSPQPVLRLGLLIGVALLVVVGMQVATRPLEAQHSINSVLIRNSIEDAGRLASEAAAKDPYWAQPAAQLAGVTFGRWLMGGRGDDALAFERAEKRMLQLDPQSWVRRRQAGGWRLQAWRARGDEKQLTAALEHYRAALERYPHSLELHAQLAWTLHLAGKREEAAKIAARGLELNEVHPHEEQRLEHVRIFDVKPSGQGAAQPAPPAEMAEQVLLELRNDSD